ncbi:MAG: phage portal protein [Pirellulales bacterium]
MTAVLDQYGDPITTGSKSSRFKSDYRRLLQAKYDAAQTTVENENHWSCADALSANASATPEIRQKLRNRSRYEYANNSYYKGMMLTRSQYVIATGPHLRITFLEGDASENHSLAEIIQRRFVAWAEQIGFTEKLSAAVTAMAIDGESFIVATNNSRIPGNQVQLDYRVYEADHVANPYWGISSPKHIDGITLDDDGYPVFYDLLKHHPGDMYFGGMAGNPIKTIPADQMLHFFRVDRPGQSRGIPWITPALPMFAQFRRFTLATLTAAEAAANAAGVVYTDSAALTADDIDMPDEDTFNMVRGSFPVMPAGWKMEQITPEHPSATFDMFRRGILSEIARCMSMPLNVATANSENHNYASGRLDHQVFHRAIVVERNWIQTNILRRVFDRWYDEALLLPGYLPSGITEMGLEASWYWDGMPHVDPQKEADATIALWEAGLITDEDYWFGTLGVDPGKQYEKLRVQQAARDAIGLPMPGGQMQEPVEAGENDEA